MDSNNSPNLQCNNQDVYTTKDSITGNSSLQYPIGLISADEIAFAGGKLNVSNINYFLNTNLYYWSLSPYLYSPQYKQAVMFIMGTNGELYSGATEWSEVGVRPVINIRADVALSGSGTTSDPFKVVGAS